MILLEVVDAEQQQLERKKDSDTLEGPSRRHIEVTLPLPLAVPPSPKLPDYATSQAQAEQQKAMIVKKKRNKKRWMRILLYALLVYLVLSVTIAIPLIVLLRKDAKQNKQYQQTYMSGNPPRPPPPRPFDIADLPPAYGQAIHCNNWTHLQSTDPNNSFYTLQYSLPANSSIYLRSNFSDLDEELQTPVTGSVLVSLTTNATEKNAVVSVKMKDIGEEPLSLASVCLMKASDGYGLAIYVPDGSLEDDYYFDIDLKLPQPTGYHNLTSLATYLPSFNQTFRSLDLYSELDTFTVQGSLGEIDVESVNAKSVFVSTSAAPISGSFNVSDTLILETVLSPIVANVSLYNPGGFSHPTHMDIETGNSDITVNVTLTTPPNATNSSDSYLDCDPPTFFTSLKTFGGSLEAAFQHDVEAVESALFVRANNNLEPARIYVDSKFEGTYDVHTTLADAVVDKSSVIDPTGANRQRVYIDDHVTATRAYGWVGWGSRPSLMTKESQRQGHIEVVSSLSSAVLQLTDAPDASRVADKVSKAVQAQRRRSRRSRRRRHQDHSPSDL